jgi:UDP-N-acetylmuramate--alanine ligase
MSAAEPTPPLDPGTRVHFVGIGGAGMSALAQLLVERGHPVSGSDLRGGRAAQAVEALGATVHIGHDPEQVGDAELVVVSNAIPADNPEVARAREAGIPVLLRAELLERLMQGYRRILVTGTHGKTTTTAMVTVALQGAGLDPSFAIGGAVHDAGTSAHHGSGDLFVAEADEAYRSFLHLTGDCAVVTNVEMDHHDAYDTEAAVAEAFAAFVARMSGAGPVVLCRDDPGATRLARVAAGPVLTYGRHPEADLRIAEEDLRPDGSSFRLVDGAADLGVFRIRAVGAHNVLNATAAVVAARWAGVDAEDLRAGLAAFSGAQRRFQRLGEANRVAVVDDYAHHPTEVAAVIAAARQARPEGRVIAVFQPHLYSRTEAFASDFGAALAAADSVLVTDVYGAREQPVPGVTGALVADRVADHGADARFVPSTGDVPEAVAELALEGDLVLTLGAGDITEVGPLILRRLEGRA